MGKYFQVQIGQFCHSLIFLLLCLVLTGCGPKAAVNSNESNSEVPANIKKGVRPTPDEQAAVIQTEYGTIVIELYPNVAPRMVERFKKLIQEGFYNGTTFHRINADSGLIQGGDPLSKDNEPSNDGTGDSSYDNVPAEFSDLPFDRGIVAAARRGAHPGFAGEPALTEAQARDTANSQFFIALGPAPQYEGKYTAFGKVVQGISTAEIIMRAPIVPGTERPAEKIVIKSITLEPRSKYPAGL